MIIVVKGGATKEQIDAILKRIEELGLGAHPIYGEHKTVIGAIGTDAVSHMDQFRNLPGVETVFPIMKPFKLASREFKGEDTVVDVGGRQFGGREVQVIAGPCSVEGREMLIETAREVSRSGATLLRGGAFKPRSSPYSFQGLGEEGLKYLAEAREITGLRVVTEVMDTRDVELVARYADALQVGARNVQNFSLLKEVGLAGKPVILKRGMSTTIQEWLLSAEYVISYGNKQVILCERGIRTFEMSTRNTLDLSAVPLTKGESHLPVIVDPSHGTGRWDLVPSMARAAVAAGADGLMIEVHPHPSRALSDGPQSLKPQAFQNLMEQLHKLAEVVGRSI